jgi:hypothetical protein
VDQDSAHFAMILETVSNIKKLCISTRMGNISLMGLSRSPVFPLDKRNYKIIRDTLMKLC